MRAPFSTAIAIVTAILLLITYFVPVDPLLQLRGSLLQWAVILTGFALLVGVLNLLEVHWVKMKTTKTGAFYSGVLIVSFIATIAVAAVFGPTGSWTLWLYNNIQIPIESSLLALLSVVLIYTLIRVVRYRTNALTIVFVVTVLLVLIGMIPFLPFMQSFRNWVLQVPVVAGSRGILLGVALGIIATGLRVITGSNRPYSG